MMEKTVSNTTMDGADDAKGNKKMSVRLAVGGMTCVACARNIVDALSELEGVSDISVNLVGKSAAAVVTGGHMVESIATLVEDIGFECKVISVTPVVASGQVDKRRTVALEFKGKDSLSVEWIKILQTYAFDRQKKFEDILEEFETNVTILDPYTSDPPNVLRISYAPSAPHFTIRTMISIISTAVSTPISAISIWRPPSSDEVAQQMYQKEQRKILFRLIVAIIAAIPTFIIGTLYMSLLKADNPGRLYFETVLMGQIQRGEWALFIISMPVMFYAAQVSWNRILSYARYNDDYLGVSSEIVTGTLVPLETGKSSIVDNSFPSFWEYEFTRAYFRVVDFSLLVTFID
jgi:P-type Cu+ transporter